MNSINSIQKIEPQRTEEKTKKRKNDEDIQNVYLENRSSSPPPLKRFKATASTTGSVLDTSQSIEKQQFLLSFEKVLKSDFDEEIMEEFIKKNFTLLQNMRDLADVSLPDYPGITPFWIAAYCNEWELVTHMLKHNPKINTAPTEGLDERQSPLWLASADQQWEIVKEMLKLNPDVNLAPSEGIDQGRSPLWLAAANEQWDIVEEMLTHKCHVNLAPTEELDIGKSPLWLSAFYKKWDIVEKMLKHDHLKHDGRKEEPNVNLAPTEGLEQGPSPLWLATAHQQWDIVKEMLKYHPDVNQAPTQGFHQKQTILWLMAFHKKWDIIIDVINTKANLNFLQCAKKYNSSIDQSVLDLCLENYLTAPADPLERKNYEDMLWYCALYLKDIPLNTQCPELTNMLKEKATIALEKAAICLSKEMDDHPENVFKNLPTELKHLIAIKVLRSSLKIHVLSDNTLLTLIEKFQTQ